MALSTALRRAPETDSAPTTKQIQQELSKIDVRTTATAETVASLQQDRDSLNEKLTATNKAIAKAEAKAAAAEKAQKGLSDTILELKKQLKTLRDARAEDTISFKKHTSAADASISKLNKLWLRVEEMDRRERERNSAARVTPSKVQQSSGPKMNSAKVYDSKPKKAY